MSALAAERLPVAPQPEPGSPSRGTAARLRGFSIRDLGVFGAFVAIFAMTLRPVVDNDLFWHLATGRYMWSTGRIPHADPFSWTAFGRAWIAHEWLTELLLYPLFIHGGYAALMLVFGVIITAAFVFAYATARLLGATRLIGVGVTLLAAVASAHTWGVRPQMESMLLMAIALWLLVRGQYRMLPPLMALWANLHGGFIFGLVLIGTFAVGELCVAWGMRPPARQRLGVVGRPVTAHQGHIGERHDGWRLWQVFGLCVAACLLNPNGWKGLAYPFSYLGNNASTRYIAEWVSPDFHQFQYQFFEALLLLLMVGMAFAPRGPWAVAARAVPSLGGLPLVTRVLLIVGFTYLGLDSVRNINLFAVIVAPIIAVYLSLAWQARGRSSLEPRPRAASATRRLHVAPGRAALNLALALFLVAAVPVASAGSLSDRHNVAVQARRFPAGAVAFLLRRRLAGPLFNSYDWGGYLIWHLYPRMRVYVDGRPDMYGDRFMDEFVRTWQALPGWQTTLRRQGVRLVLVEPGSGLGRALAASRDWRLAYHDAISVLYVYRGSGGRGSGNPGGV